MTDNKKGNKDKGPGRIQVPIEEEGDQLTAKDKATGDNGKEGAAQSEGESLPSLQAQLEEKTKEAAGYYEQWLRLRAEFENYKKRMEKERADFIKFGNESLLRAILPIIDNLDRAIDHGKDIAECSSLLEGVRMTQKQFLGILEKFGMKTFSAQGEIFDPERHEALYHEESDQEPNRVIGEVEKGYLFHDRLLRPAKVIVSKGKGSSAPQGIDA